MEKSVTQVCQQDRLRKIARLPLTLYFNLTYRIESRQLASQVDDKDDDDRLPVAALLEEFMYGEAALSVCSLFLHFFQLRKHLICAAS